MKKFALLFLLTCLITVVYSYNYQSVYSHRTAMFQQTDGKIIGFKTDSVVFNGDSVFFPLKNIQAIGPNCYRLDGASRMGPKIVVRPDWNYFFNRNNDTIKIKTNARLHEGWKFYEDENLLVEAIVNFHDTMTVLGVIDSVKTIELQAYYKTTPGKFAHETLLLSKRYGLVKTMNFIMFPELPENEYYFQQRLETFTLVGIDHPKLGVQNLTWFEVFDFQPGDEIHTKNTEGQYWGIQLPMLHTETTTRDALRYLNRVNFADSIVYTIDRKRDVVEQTNDSVRWVTFRHDTITSIIKRNKQFDQLPGTPVLNDDMAMLYRMDAGNPVSKSDMDQRIFFIKTADNCWSIPPWDGCMFVNKYLKGLGGPYGYCMGMAGETLKKELVYYKKGNVEQGLPFKKIRADYKPLIQKTKSWQVLRSSCCPDIQQYRHTAVYKLDHDTLVNDLQVFTSLLSAKDSEGKDFRLQGYLREDRLTGRVYYKPANKRDKAFVLYDFEMQAGDTLMTTDFRMDVPLAVCNRVDSVDSVQFAGVWRKRLFVSSYHPQMPGNVTSQVWIEGVGGTAGLLESSLPAMIGSEITQLLCVQVYGAEVYHHPELPNCFYWQDFKDVLPYQTVYPGRTSLFRNEMNGLVAMKIDSVGYLNPQLLYPLKNIRSKGEICYDPAGASFLGEKIQIADGWNYYFDHEGDTICVKTHARVGDSWVLSQKPEMKIQATVSAVEKMDILGLNDSVLVIKLMAYDKNMSVILTHPLNNKSIRLSRLNGWVTIFNTYDLPFTDYSQMQMYELAGMDKPKVGVQNLTWFEVFDFQPGDEYHSEFVSTQSGGGPSTTTCNKSVRKILTRTDYQDSIVYEVSESIEFTQLMGSQLQYKDLEHYQYRFPVKANPDFDVIPGKSFVSGGSLRSNYMIKDEFVKKGSVSIPYNTDSACYTYWEDVVSDVCNYGSSEYYAGLGGPYYQYISGCWDSGSTTYKLVYYKKGSQTWGTPFMFLDNNELYANSGFAVYPNPARDILNLKIDAFVPGVRVRILNLQGAVLSEWHPDAAESTVDLTSFPAGIYLCQFVRENEIVKVVRFSKMH